MQWTVPDSHARIIQGQEISDIGEVDRECMTKIDKVKE
jgi:hypothetical protein